MAAKRSRKRWTRRDRRIAKQHGYKREGRRRVKRHAHGP